MQTSVPENDCDLDRAMRTFQTIRWVWIALQVAFVMLPMMHVLIDPSATSQNIRGVDLLNMLALYGALQIVTLPVAWLAWTRPRELPEDLDDVAIERILILAARTRRAIVVLVPALVMAPIGLCVMIYQWVEEEATGCLAQCALVASIMIFIVPTMLSSMTYPILIYAGLCALAGAGILVDFWWYRPAPEH